ncbi:F-box domain containing protein [Trema orientale]|uniref:F-box domain containing protein n=1 Tax=Trema orientale TaxID=63057 RepID=A0A2P5CV17_TREOI|nr:F-box domain containing protein [Trema orientale]
MENGDQEPPRKRFKTLSTGNIEQERAQFELSMTDFTEILSWLPVESLLRFKSVCKEWCSLIETEYFIQKHMSQVTPISLKDNKFQSIKARSFSILYVSDGLLLEKDFAHQNYRLRNPATHQVIYLPNPCLDGILHRGFEFDFNPSTGEGRLVCECLEMDMSRFLAVDKGLKLLNVGRDRSWKFLRRPMWEGKGQVEVVRAYDVDPMRDGEIHFVRIICSENQLSLDVLSFDVRREYIAINTLPKGVFSDFSKGVFPFWWDNRLAVADIIEEGLHVMVLEKYRNQCRWSWSRNKTVIPLRFLGGNIYQKEELVPLEATKKELWFRYGRDLKVCYDMKIEKITQTIALKTNHALEYRPSLRTLRGMRPEHFKERRRIIKREKMDVDQLQQLLGGL